MSKVKSQKPNKSATIRDYKAANPDATPKGIAWALAKPENGGVKVSAQFVSTVLSNAKKGKGISGRRGPKIRSANRPLKVTKAKFSDSVRAIRLIDELRTVAHRLGVSVEALLEATAPDWAPPAR